METKHIKISDYNYELPDERIAKFPIAQRDHSKLLVYKHGEVSDDVFHHLPTYLPQGALMIFNNTKVIQARLHFRKETGALIEVFLMEPAEPTDVLPILNWGESQSEIKAMQRNLVINVENDTLLRFANNSKTLFIDYFFKSNNLVSVSMTQANIANVKDVMNKWTDGYTEVSSNENDFVSVSQDKSTLAYGKTVAGTKFNYATVAWSAIVSSDDDNDDEYDFTPSGSVDGYDYVDLGIGIGWATANVGAKTPGDSGGYYMWAETVEHSNYNWWYYSLYTGSTSGYLDPDAFRTPYTDISGTSYDVARNKMGNHWRMPTRAELSSLANQCEFTKGTYDNVEGFIVTGPSRKSIFLPNAGCKYKDGYRWNYPWLLSSYTYGKQDAYGLKLNKAGDVSIDHGYKYYGYTVRGVTDL